MADDPSTEAVMRAVLAALDTQESDKVLAYEDILRRLQDVLVACLRSSPDEVSPEQAQALALALARLHPRADDARLEPLEHVRRLLERVDLELFRWTSAMVQPVGPSGATAVAAHEEPADA